PDLRPGKPRHRGECRCRAFTCRKRGQVLREVIRPFQAWDAVACSAAMLDPGVVLNAYRIQSFAGDAGSEAYGVEFHWLGRRYTCPLYLFQARTQAVEPVPVGEIPAREA